MKTTELVFILDKSGSMSGLESDTIGGFNSMLEKQRNKENPCIITTILFDHSYQLLHDRLDINQVANLTNNDYQVGGSTALLDAIGKGIEKTNNVQSSLSKTHNVLFVIITDGEENSSIQYTSSAIKEMIESQKKNNWEFIFLGANIDAIETAQMFGISQERSSNYIPDEEGTKLNFETINETVSFFRSEGMIKNDSLSAIKKDNKERK